MRVEAGGVELWSEGFVVGDGDGGVVHYPLADAGDLLAVPCAGRDGVEAPVDEHAEAGFAPPLHAGVLLSGGLGVLAGGDGVVDGGGVGGGACELRVADGAGGEKGDCDSAEGWFQGGSPGKFLLQENCM